MNAADGKLRAARLDGHRPNAAPAHTPEPWRVGRVVDRGVVRVDQADLDGVFRADIADVVGKANADRIVACVNALQGVADPAAVRALVEALRDIEKRLAAIEANARHATTLPHELDIRVGLNAEVRWRIVGQAVDAINEARAALAAFPDGAK